MSKSAAMTDHQQAVSVYLQDMLTDSLEITNSTSPKIAEIQQAIEQAPLISVDDNDPQAWRESPFQVVLFDVYGLQLAVPLHELNDVMDYPTTHNHDADQTQIIDTANIIFPENYQRADESPKYIVIIGDNKWGLACNDIIEVTTLSPDQIRWRQQLGKRPWLAGTVLSQMCSILNVKELIKQLEH